MSWRYVPTEANPANDITRRLSLTELGTGFRYSSGLKFPVYESAELWPENKVKAPCENDEKGKMGWSISGRQGPVGLEEVFVADQGKKSYILCDAICRKCKS